jgi:hypothetical protein
MTMPKIFLPLTGTKESVLRPVVFDITRQLMKITNITPDNVQIYYPGDVEHIPQQGSAIGQADEPNLLQSNERIAIEVQEEYDPERLLSTAIHRPEHLPIFRDDRIETMIRPTYSPQIVTISYRYRAQDETQAIRWRDDIRGRVAMMRDQNVHSLAYHYLIPEEFLVVLQELHRMRETVAGYGEDYDTYFKSNATTRASILTTLVGTKPAWGISETQARVMGWFDFDGTPEKGSKDDDSETWTISFDYKFMFDKPIGCAMAYPVMVHNQIVGTKYREVEPSDHLGRKKLSYSHSAACFSQFEQGFPPVGYNQGYQIPAFDEFIPSSVPVGTLRVFTGLTQVDEANPYDLLSLKDLGNYVIHPELLVFLKEEISYLTRPYQSPFVLSFYEGVYLQKPNAIWIDEELKIYSNKLLSLRQYYHVRLSLVEDFSLLQPRALERLRENGNILILILKAIGYPFELPKLMGNYVSRIEMSKVLSNMGLMNGTGAHGQPIQFNTVEVLFVQAEEIKHAPRQ